MSDDPIRGALRKHLQVRHDWLATQPQEETLEPDLPIVDAHHHVWNQVNNRYMLDDVLAEFGSGHRVVASVAVQAHSMYRADGPEELKPVGETEFLNGIAAQCASGDYGAIRLAAGIVGTTDLMLGDGVEPVLEAHLRAGGSRFRGIRPTTAWHESDQVRALDIQPHLLRHAQARAAIRRIQRHGLCLDLWLFFTQLDEACEICRAFPELTVVINHAGGPLGIGPYAGRRDEVFAQWRAALVSLAECPNAVLKIGGLAMRYAGFEFHQQAAPPSSDALAEAWRPYIHAGIEAFGPERCMFESNFPVDRAMCNYHAMWNAFKKTVKDFSADDKAELFHCVAARTYRISV